MIALGMMALLVAGSASPSPANNPDDLSEFFTGGRGTFVLLDIATGHYARYDSRRAAERFSPCSTFKIPHALIGIETGVLSGAEHRMAWDGVPRDVAEWNEDHALRTAIARSVVWYFQRVAASVGGHRMRQWLHAVHYGNEDISGGLTSFWLMSSLAISAEEQVAFLSRLVRGDLPFSDRSMVLVRDLLRLRESSRGVLHGKTGSGQREDGSRLGWFVGWVDAPGGAKIFALNIAGPQATGALARETVERILVARGML